MAPDGCSEKGSGRNGHYTNTGLTPPGADMAIGIRNVVSARCIESWSPSKVYRIVTRPDGQRPPRNIRNGRHVSTKIALSGKPFRNQIRSASIYRLRLYREGKRRHRTAALNLFPCRPPRLDDVAFTACRTNPYVLLPALPRSGLDRRIDKVQSARLQRGLRSVASWNRASEHGVYSDR